MKSVPHRRSYHYQAYIALIFIGWVLPFFCEWGDTLQAQIETEKSSVSMPRPDMALVPEKRLLEAVEAAQAAVVKDPKSAAAWGKLGHIYYVHDWEAEGVVCYQRAVELEPDAFRWRYYLGWSVYHTNPALAAEALEKAIALQPEYAPAHIYYAHALRSLGHIEEAWTHFERGKMLQPGNSASDLALGQIALKKRELEKARLHLKIALILNPKQSAAHAALSQVYLALGDREAAKQHAEASREPTQFTSLDDPLADDAWSVGVTKAIFGRRGRRLAQGGFHKLAAAELDKAVSEDEKNPLPWLNYGAILVNAERYTDAVSALERGLLLIENSDDADEIDPKKIRRAYLNLGMAYRYVGETGAAKRFLKRALDAAQNPVGEKRPDSEQIVKIYVNLGIACWQDGEAADAERYFRQALDADATSTLAIKNMAVFHYKQGRRIDAINLLRTATQKQPDPELMRLLNQMERG